MNCEIRSEVHRRRIGRLCHVTPFRNLVHIANGEGLLSTKFLKCSERREFNQQDLERLDGHPDHICCSIEYPNAWYLRSKREGNRSVRQNFPDWVCVTFNPNHLWAETTLFCPQNASAECGSQIGAGSAMFNSLFATCTLGSKNRTFSREQLPQQCPTNDQAEVLVLRHIPYADIQHVIVADESQAKRIFVGLSQLEAQDDLFQLRICPEFFDPVRLSKKLRSGIRPTEVDWSLLPNSND